jgi:predicted RNase H-like HicB family nuclease
MTVSGLSHTIKAYVRRGESHYVAECLEISVITQGRTLDETIRNLEEAVALHLEGEDPAAFGLAPHPTLLVTLELDAPPRVP